MKGVKKICKNCVDGGDMGDGVKCLDPMAIIAPFCKYDRRVRGTIMEVKLKDCFQDKKKIEKILKEWGEMNNTRPTINDDLGIFFKKKEEE